MFSPVKARRIFEEVVVQIREQIETGKLKPGDKLPAERDLAEQLGVSRTAVREALRVLEIAGTGGCVTASRDGGRGFSLDACHVLGHATSLRTTRYAAGGIIRRKSMWRWR